MLGIVSVHEEPVAACGLLEDGIQASTLKPFRLKRPVTLRYVGEGGGGWGGNLKVC